MLNSCLSNDSSVVPSSERALDSLKHWEIDYRKIFGIYRNFDGKLLHSYFTTVSEVFLGLIAPLWPFQSCSKSNDFVVI